MTLLPAAHAAAAPSPRERAAVVAIDLGPSAPAYLREKAAGQIEAGLAVAGYEVVPVGGRLTGELARCREGACVRRIGEALGVRSLVLARIDGEGENTIVTIRLHDGRTGEREAEVHEVCDLCGEAELAGRLRTAASALRARSLDTRVRAAQRARTGETRSILPGVLLGTAGAAGVAGGLYLVAIHGRGTCGPGDGPVYPDPGAVIRYLERGGFECRDVYQTRTLGIASAGVGVVALAAGVALTVRARQRERIIEVLPQPGGATIGVSGSW